MDRGDRKLLGRAAQALPHLRRAVELAPEMTAAWYNLGAAHAVEGRRDDAVTAMERALALESGYVKARVGLARLLADAGRLDAARPHFEAARRLAPRDAAVAHRWGEALLAAGEREAARAIDPGRAESRRLLERAGTGQP